MKIDSSVHWVLTVYVQSQGDRQNKEMLHQLHLPMPNSP